jgi:transcriptional regulator with XRE-family HTH domain
VIKRSLKLSEEGRNAVRISMMRRGWTSRDVAEKLGLSMSTLKRFVSQNAVSVEYFRNICELLEIDLESAVEMGSEVEEENSNSNTLNFSHTKDNLQELESQTKYAIAVTGVFTEEQRLQVETTALALKNLLSNSQITFSTSDQAKEH